MGMMAGTVLCFISVIGGSLKTLKLTFLYELFGISRYGIENLWSIRLYGFTTHTVASYTSLHYRGQAVIDF